MSKAKCNKKCNRVGGGYIINERKILYHITRNVALNNGSTTMKDLEQVKGLTRRQRYYLVNSLIKKELIKNLEKSVFLLVPTEKGKAHVRNLVGELQSDGVSVTQISDRGNDIMIYYPCKRPDNVIPRGYTPSDRSDKLHWSKPLLTYTDEKNRFSSQISPCSVTYLFTDIYGPDAHHLILTAINKSVELVNELRKEGFEINIPDHAVVSQHHALHNKELGQYTIKYGITWKSDRMVFDKSISHGEIELVHKGSAPEDFLMLISLLEGFVREKFTVQEFLEWRELMPDLKKIIKQKKMEEKKQNERYDK